MIKNFLAISLIFVMISCSPQGLSQQECESITHWSILAQEWYFDSNNKFTNIDEAEVWLSTLENTFYKLANVHMPPKSPTERHRILELIEQNTGYMESYMSGFSSVIYFGEDPNTIEPIRLQLNETIRNINTLLEPECGIEPLILYKERPSL